MLSTYQIWLFHIHSIFICSAEAYVQQCHDISLSVDYIAKHKPISSFKKTKVNSKFLGFRRFSFVAIIWDTMIILNPPPPPPLYKGGGGRGRVFIEAVLKLFTKSGGFRFFPQKARGWYNRRADLRKGVSLIFLLILSSFIFLSVWCACVYFVYLHHFYQYCLFFKGRNYSYWI